ncbi:unnamed protein product [Ectocarpus fasciculatus]
MLHSNHGFRQQRRGLQLSAIGDFSASKSSSCLGRGAYPHRVRSHVFSRSTSMPTRRVIRCWASMPPRRCFSTVRASWWTSSPAPAIRGLG